MVGILDHRQADVYVNSTNASRRAQEQPLSDDEKARCERFAQPQYWIDEQIVRERRYAKTQGDWELVFCDVTSSTNERTSIAAIVPISGLTRSLPALYLDTADARDAALLVGLMSSLAFDYFCRLKVSSNHFTQGILASMPLPEKEAIRQFAMEVFDEIQWFEHRVLELLYTATDLSPFARELGYDGPPFHWDVQRRLDLQTDLHAAFFLLYGLSWTEVEHALSTFPTLKRKEVERYGEFRTLRLVEEKYNAFKIKYDNRYAREA